MELGGARTSEAFAPPRDHYPCARARDDRAQPASADDDSYCCCVCAYAPGVDGKDGNDDRLRERVDHAGEVNAQSKPAQPLSVGERRLHLEPFKQRGLLSKLGKFASFGLPATDSCVDRLLVVPSEIGYQ